MQKQFATPLSNRPRRAPYGRIRDSVISIVAAIAVLGGVGYVGWRALAPQNDSATAASDAGAGATPAGKASADGRGPSGFGGPGGPGIKRGNLAQPVSVGQVERKDIRVTASAIGTISAANTAVVRAQVTGVLQTLNFREGQQVRAGQVLAQIDPRSFQAAAAQAEGVLARDQAQLENARIDLTRYQDLWAKDAIPRQTLDTQAALVRQLEGTVRSDRASLDSAQLQLTFTRVVAPISGRAGLKQADLGNIVQTSDTNGIVSIAQTQPAALTFAVPAALLPQISQRLANHQPVTVRATDKNSNSRLAQGEVSSLDNAIDASTDTIKVKALFANKDSALFPNQTVSVQVLLDTLKDALTVPQTAVLRGAQGFYVYVVNPDNSVKSVTVQPGPVDNGFMAVSGALEVGQKVVVDGVDRLRNGAKVEVIVPGAAGAGAGAQKWQKRASAAQ